MFVALTLAEMGSAAPTSGGLYYWTWTFATPRWRKVLSWTVGCEYTRSRYSDVRFVLSQAFTTDSNTIGLISGIASIDWGCAVQLMAAVSIGTNQEFIPTTGQT